MCINIILSFLLSLKPAFILVLRDPFGVSNPEEATILARYLVEDIDDEYFHYDENLTNNVSIIKSIMKKLVGNLPNFSENKKKILANEIYEVMKHGK